MAGRHIAKATELLLKGVQVDAMPRHLSIRDYDEITEWLMVRFYGLPLAEIRGWNPVDYAKALAVMSQIMPWERGSKLG